jgi:murein DD-endopeptidase MepM/ murein hydrolase activator NlpD
MTVPVQSQIKTKSSPWKTILKWTVLSILLIIASLFIFLSISTSVTTNADKYAYTLPFEAGTKHRIVQGYGGLFSHKNIAALDFDMPVGTSICAAREGIIYSYKDNSNEGGPFPGYKSKANYIIIKHDDGSLGCYWHLKYKGVITKSGRVSKGQIIGYSGSTGFLFSPHLHFSVKRKLGYQKDFFVKTKFITISGLHFLSMWRNYKRPVE